jgi:hypothetical protein
MHKTVADAFFATSDKLNSASFYRHIFAINADTIRLLSKWQLK